MWQRKRPERGPVEWAWKPVTDRDERGRLYDGDRVRPPGRERWADLLLARPADPPEPRR